MKKSSNKKKGILFISPLTLSGILLILLPIFGYLIFDSIKVHREQVASILIEKGVALIRTFEAGTRLGMMTMYWGNDSVQKLLTETSYQPEIEYMMIVDRSGKILAHSDPDMVSREWDSMPDIKADVKDYEVFHRQKINLENNQTFEVYKRFTPTKREFESGPRVIIRIKRVGKTKQTKLKDHKNENPGKKGLSETSPGNKSSWFKPYIFAKSVNPLGDKTPEHFIFVGLAMGNIKVAQNKFLKKVLGKGIVLLLIGVAGIICLLAFQGYRSAKATLIRVQDFSDTVVDNMPSGLVILNTEMEISSVNKGAEQILGPDPEFLLPELADLAKEMTDVRTTIHKEVVCTLRNNKNILLDISASVIKEDDSISGYLFLLKDLTELVQLKKEVETGKRLAAIGKLAAGVAHEIRNPLSSIKGFATYFSERSKNVPQDKEIADIMVQEVERINRSVSALLEFAKPMPLTLKKIDLQDLVSHSLKLVEHDLKKKNIQSRFSVNLDDKIITTDPDRINQVLLNLFLNSIQAMDKNGALEVNLFKTSDNHHLVFEIKDNGKGIEQDQLDKIFDPYFTTRNNGTGLGLAIVHRIIDALGGEIKVDSMVNSGTSFVIKLPV